MPKPQYLIENETDGSLLLLVPGWEVPGRWAAKVGG